MTFDLSTLNTAENAEEGAWLELEHPSSGEPLGIHIKLVGVDSKTYNKQLRKQQDKRLKKQFKNISAQELENESIELLVACTLDWEGVIFEENALECNKENVRWLYKNFKWIREACDDFIGERAHFLGE